MSHGQALHASPVPVENIVSIVHRDDIAQAVQTAIDLAGGLDDIEPGQTVFIKPNVVHPFVNGPAITTNTEVIKAIVRICKARGAIVTVGDRSARQYNTTDALDGSGIRSAALEAGADVVYAALRPQEDPGAWVLLQPPRGEETWAHLGGVLAMRRIIEADHFINVPTCKNHRWAGYSLSMKAHMGSIGDDSRHPLHFTIGQPDRLARDLAIFNQLFEPRLNIIDAWDSLINGGPEGVGTDAVTVPSRLILAGRDRLALDAMAFSVIKLGRSRTPIPEPDQVAPFNDSHTPWTMPQITYGIEFGLGASSPAEVVLRFDNVADEAALTAVFQS